MMRVGADLLVTPECPHALLTEERLRGVAAELEVDVVVRHIVIDDLDEAASYGFPGSPTLRIGGRDAVPARAGASGEAVLGCRLYRDEDGTPSGAVPSDAIREALIRAILARQRPGPLDRLAGWPGRAMRGLLVWASHQPRIELLVRRLPASRALVERFIAGDDLRAALATLARLRAAGFATTVDVLGEAVTDTASAMAATDRYLAVLDALAEHGLDGNVSLKLTQLGLGVEAGLARSNLRRVCGHARGLGAFVRVDMEDSSRTQVTLDLVRDTHAEHGNVGAVIQAYLRRSAEDVEDLNRSGIRVRLCKGAYSEPPRVAFTSKREVDESFALLAERLLLEGTYPALATHDERLIEAARTFARRHAIAASGYEFQMLHGIRRDLQARLVDEGETVRVYVPFGPQWYAYYMRRLAERPANVLFILRNLVRRGG
jgi:proline dehydrogenase